MPRDSTLFPFKFEFHTSSLCKNQGKGINAGTLKLKKNEIRDAKFQRYII